MTFSVIRLLLFPVQKIQAQCLFAFYIWATCSEPLEVLYKTNCNQLLTYLTTTKGREKGDIEVVHVILDDNYHF